MQNPRVPLAETANGAVAAAIAAIDKKRMIDIQVFLQIEEVLKDEKEYSRGASYEKNVLQVGC